MNRLIVRSLFLVAVSAVSTQAAVSLTGATYTQNFDSLQGFTGTVPADGFDWTNDFADPSNATIPGWSVFTRSVSGNYSSGTPSVPVVVGNQMVRYQPTAGTRNTNAPAQALASFGSSGSSDRALGNLMVATTTDFAGSVGDNPQGAILTVLALRNDTGQTIDSVTITYDGEQWRKASNQTNAHTITTQFSMGSYSAPSDFISAANANGWSGTLANLTFTGPQVNTDPGSAEALDGNDAGNRVAGLTRTISAGDFAAFPATGIAPGQTFYIRWTDLNNTDNDHGLAIDNVSIAYTVIPEPASLAALAGLGAMTTRRRRRA